MAWMPYVLLVVCVLVWGSKPLTLQLNAQDSHFRMARSAQPGMQIMPPVAAKPDALRGDMYR